MNIDEDIEKRSIWTNIALFMVGIAILGFMSMHKNNENEQVDQQSAEQIPAGYTSQSNVAENSDFIKQYYDFEASNATAILETMDVSPQTDFRTWTNNGEEQAETDNELLITASR